MDSEREIRFQRPCGFHHARSKSGIIFSYKLAAAPIVLHTPSRRDNGIVNWGSYFLSSSAADASAGGWFCVLVLCASTCFEDINFSWRSPLEGIKKGANLNETAKYSTGYSRISCRTVLLKLCGFLLMCSLKKAQLDNYYYKWTLIGATENTLVTQIQRWNWNGRLRSSMDSPVWYTHR